MTSKQFINGCDKVIVFSFYALIYFLPISTALVEISSTFIITAFFFKRGAFLNNSRSFSLESITRTFKFPSTYLNGPLGWFVFINFLSVVFSHVPALSVQGFIFKLFQGIVLFFAFVECMCTKKQIKIFVSVCVVSMVLVIMNGVAQYFQGKGFVHGHLFEGGRLISSFKHANDFGAYLVVALPLFLSCIMSWLPRLSLRRAVGERKNNESSCPLAVKVGVVIVFFAALFCLGFTFSRGAWIGFFCSLIFLGFKRINVIYVPILITVLFLTIFLPRLAVTRQVSFTSDSVTQGAVRVDSLGQAIPSKERFTGRSRTIWWREAVSIIREFPALGTGLNTYSRVAPGYKLQWEGGVYPHNCYLQMTAETGILGLGSFLWVLFVLFRRTCKNLRTMKDEFLSTILVGALSGLFGYLVHSFFDTNFYSVQLGNLMWIMMGLIVAIQSKSVNQEK